MKPWTIQYIYLSKKIPHFYVCRLPSVLDSDLPSWTAHFLALVDKIILQLIVNQTLPGTFHYYSSFSLNQFGLGFLCPVITTPNKEISNVQVEVSIDFVFSSFSFFPRSRFLTYAFLPVFNFWLIICPYRLSYDWQMGSIPLIESPWDPRNLATALFYLIFSLLLHRAFIFKVCPSPVYTKYMCKTP